MRSPLGAPGATERDGAAGADRPVLALDIGGTKTAAAVVDVSGRTHSFVVAATETEREPERALEAVFELGRRAVAEAGVGPAAIDAVGIGCGGPLDAEQGILLNPPHLRGWRDLPISALAEEAFERPAVLENDGAAAAAGEHRYGAGVGTRHMVYLTISTGVGGGVIADGRLSRGAHGNGGELGHVTVDWNGRVCRGCGRRGCLEAYASGTSIAERVREALDASDGSSTLGSSADATAAAVAAAARDGDALARAVWEETVRALACGVISIVNVFEPELVVLGGGVSREGEQLLAPVREAVREQAMTPGGRAANVVPARLGDRVGVVGAAAVAFERIEAGALPARG